MTDKWDPSIPEHKELAHMIEIGNGIPEMRPIAMAREALVKVGFEILHEEDLAERPDEVPWYYPLEGDVFKAQTLWDVFTCWRTSSSGKFVSHHGLRLLEFAGVVPKGTWDVCETLKIAGDALVRTGQQKVRQIVCHLCHTADRVVCRSSRRCTSSLARSLWTRRLSLSWAVCLAFRIYLDYRYPRNILRIDSIRIWYGVISARVARNEVTRVGLS